MTRKGYPVYAGFLDLHAGARAMSQELIWLAAGGLLLRVWWLLPAWWLALTRSRCAAALIREQARGELERLRARGAVVDSDQLNAGSL